MAAIQADLEATTFLTLWESVGDEFSRISITNLKADIQATFNGYYQPLDATLTALATLDNTAGLLTQTGADTFVRRTLTGTANEIDIANSTGAVGNPTASLPATLVLTGKTVTVDTQAQADNSTKAASTGYVRAAIAAVLNGVSAAFDTLSEIATELGLKAYSATTITAGAGLTGGGDLSASRTIDVGAGTGIAVNANNVALADMAQSTIKGRAAGAGTGAPTDLSATQATAILNAFVGDGGSGGVKGLVPAPATGDATKFLRGDGTFVAIAGGGDMLAANNLSDVANVNTARQNLRAGVIGETIWFNQSYAPADFLIEDGSSVSSATYALLFAVLVRSATVTISNASPGVVTWTAHNLKVNDPGLLHNNRRVAHRARRLERSELHHLLRQDGAEREHVHSVGRTRWRRDQFIQRRQRHAHRGQRAAWGGEHQSRQLQRTELTRRIRPRLGCRSRRRHKPRTWFGARASDPEPRAQWHSRLVRSDVRCELHCASGFRHTWRGVVFAWIIGRRR